MEGNIKDAWGWIGGEIAGFGFRWAIVCLVMFGFGGWIGKRYWDLKREVQGLKEQAAAPDKIVTDHGIVTIGGDGLHKLTTWLQLKYGNAEPLAPSTAQFHPSGEDEREDDR